MVKISIGTKGIDFSWTDGGNPVKDPPKGLEPVGDSGWYVSPEVVDPRDCENYPDSPWCGGNPIDPALQVNLEINIDPCGFTFTQTSSALIKFPQFTQTYRKPGACRREYEREPEPARPPDIPGADYTPPPFSMPSGFDVNEIVVCAIAYQIFYISQNWNPRLGAYGTFTQVYKSSGSNAQNPSSIYYAGRSGQFGTPKLANCSIDFSYSRIATNDAIYIDFYGDKSSSFSSSGIAAIDSRQDFVVNPTGGYWAFKKGGWNSAGEIDAYTVNIYEGTFGEIESYLGDPNAKDIKLQSGIDVQGRLYENREISITEVTVLFCVRKNTNDYRKNPPSLNEKKECCMQCCFAPPSFSQSNQDDSCCKAVLEIVKRIDKNLGTYPGKVTIFDTNETSKGAQSKVIEFSTVSQAFTRAIERIEKISKIIGIDDLPLTVPKSIVDPVDQSIIDLAIGFFTGDTEKINNLFEYHVWFLKQFSAVTGKYMIEIEVPDTDVLQEGEQGVDDGNAQTSPKNKIVIPDISTGIREIIMMQIALYKTLGLNLDTSLLTLSQSALCMKEIGRVGAEVDEIVDFLDYPTDDAARDIPVFVTVPEKNLTNEEQNDLIKYLKPSQVKVKYNNWNGQQSLRELFIHFASRMGGRA